jgi:hypothetical protein
MEDDGVNEDTVLDDGIINAALVVVSIVLE